MEKMPFKILGVSGTNGSGKDTISDLLGEKHNFFVASATHMLADELVRLGRPVDRKHKAALSTEWRKQYGMGAVVDKALELFEPVKDQYDGFVVGSLRHPGEADRVHELGGLVVWCDADSQVRYDRIVAARGRANKAAEDDVTYDEFLAQEAAEMQHHSGDTATLSTADVKAKADIFIMNNGSDIEAFKLDATAELLKASPRVA